MDEAPDRLTFLRVYMTYLTQAGNTLDRKTLYAIKVTFREKSACWFLFPFRLVNQDWLWKSEKINTAEAIKAAVEDLPLEKVERELTSQSRTHKDLEP